MLSFKTIFTTIVLFLTVNIKSQELQLNEVVSKNYNDLQSFENNPEDWIEVYNNSSDTLDLENYFLSDKKSDLQLWQFPNLKLAPDSFLVVFASGKNIVSPQLHTNFSINAAGENIYLYKTEIVDSAIVPALKADYSFGRIQESSNEWQVLDIPSPNNSNIISNSFNFSKKSGFFDLEFHLKINLLRAGHTIHYTFDGSAPDKNSQVFLDSLLIEDRSYIENSISKIRTTPHESVHYHNWEEPEPFIRKINSIKFVTYDGQKLTSKVHTLNFLIEPQDPLLKTICVTIDSLDLFSKEYGIYLPGNSYSPNDVYFSGNYFSNRKVKAHFSLFDKEKNEILNTDTKARVFGKATRSNAQKSFKFFAKKETGVNEFIAPIVENDFYNYNSFILRSTQGSRLRCLLSDDFAMNLVKDLDIDFAKSEFCNVFINGSYWGIQSLRNDSGEDFLQRKYNLKKEDINIIDVDYKAVLGDNTSFINLISFIENNDLSLTQNYNKVANGLDVNSYIDYQIAEMFMNNSDWPGSNSKLWKSNKPNSKWRFLFYDLDGSFIDVKKNMLDFCTSEKSDNWRNYPRYTFLLRNLLKNKHFENQFVTRYVDLLKNDFSASNTINNLILNIDKLSPYVQENYERWAYPCSKEDWIERIEDEFISFLAKRPCIVKDQLEDFFNLSSIDIDCSINTKELLKFKISPNPNNGIYKLTIESKLKNAELKYEVYDVRGQLKRQDFIVFEQDGLFHFHIHDLPHGLYFFKLLDSNNFYGSEKLLIFN